MTKVKTLFSKFAYGVLGFMMLATMVSGIVGNAQRDLLPTRGELCLSDEGCALTGDDDFEDGETGIVNILVNVAETLTFIAGGVAVLFLVYGGFLFIVDPGGSGAGATKGKTIIFNALIGLVICVAAFTIVNILGGLVTSTEVTS